jgi:uncharacterized protein (TIGR03435 family)
MFRARTLAVLCSLFALTASAQTSAQTADPVARVFHPASPLPSYDVATIKPFVPVTMPNGMTFLGGNTVRQYIRMAFGLGIGQLGSGQLAAAQVVGGPDWIDKDKYDIKGKPSPDLEQAIKKMKPEDQSAQNRMMQQSLLADRFHLKIHFEVREMPVYTLVPAKGGLKIKAVDAPAARDANTPLPRPVPGGPPPPGMSVMMMNPGGARSFRASATQMSNLLNLIVREGGIGDRPIIDQTGFTGYFDIPDLTFAQLSASSDASSPASDAPSLATALEQTLGLRLVLTKAPVEVVVIDSIDHPSEN